MHATTRDVGHDALAHEHAEALSEDGPRHAYVLRKPLQRHHDVWRAMHSCKCLGYLWVSETAKPTSRRSRGRRQERTDCLNEQDVGDALGHRGRARCLREGFIEKQAQRALEPGWPSATVTRQVNDAREAFENWISAQVSEREHPRYEAGDHARGVSEADLQRPPDWRSLRPRPASAVLLQHSLERSFFDPRCRC